MIVVVTAADRDGSRRVWEEGIHLSTQGWNRSAGCSMVGGEGSRKCRRAVGAIVLVMVLGGRWRRLSASSRLVCRGWLSSACWGRDAVVRVMVLMGVLICLAVIWMVADLRKEDFRRGSEITFLDRPPTQSVLDCTNLRRS